MRVNDNPLVTVFMAVYNGERYITEAIKSILNQSFDDFELLIINDGSTDNSAGIIRKFDDPRIRLLSNERNKGLFYTRNRGISEARGKFYATLDCDDVSTPHRLELQVKFFQENPDYVICGGQGRIINSDSKIIGAVNAPVGNTEFLRVMHLFSDPFINSATMIRKEILDRYSFRPYYEPAEDYDLFQRISEQYKIANLSKVLVHYRVHELNVSEKKEDIRVAAEHQIIERQLKKLGVCASKADLKRQHCFVSKKFPQDYNLKAFEDWLLCLDRVNLKTRYYPVTEFREALFYQWANALSFYLGSYAILMKPFTPIARLQKKRFVFSYFLNRIMNLRFSF
jgi:glycosyltransferase involved in cell wall biosynthesis